MLKDLDERTVELMAQRSTLATFEEGELLHQAGEPMDAVSFLSQGRAKVYRVSADGKQQTIVLLGPGDAFREIGIVDRSEQDLYVEALDHVVVCRTTCEAFLQLASRDPELAVAWPRPWARSCRQLANRSPTSPFATSVAASLTCC